MVLDQLIGNIYASFSEIVHEINILEYFINDYGIYLKANIVFNGGSSLRIIQSEKPIGNILRYSYYWLNRDNQLILGWDNAPHHKELDSYPHHKHVGSQYMVLSSFERCLDDVLNVIKHELDKNNCK